MNSATRATQNCVLLFADPRASCERRATHQHAASHKARSPALRRFPMAATVTTNAQTASTLPAIHFPHTASDFSGVATIATVAALPPLPLKESRPDWRFSTCFALRRPSKRRGRTRKNHVRTTWICERPPRLETPAKPKKSEQITLPAAPGHGASRMARRAAYASPSSMSLKSLPAGAIATRTTSPG